MYNLITLLSVLPFALGAALVPRNSSSVACNNSPALCSRSYSSITHLGAHDSPFLRDASTDNSQSGNQLLNVTLQLDAGVRLLTAQAHDNNGSLHLCHTSCALLDAGLLSTWLAEIKSWMDKNPNDVVTIIIVNSDQAPASTLHQHFVTADITKYTYTPQQNAGAIQVWPTLQTLIAKNNRLITFVADIDPATTVAANAPYLLDQFSYVFENPYEVTSASNFTCTPFRPLAVKGNVTAALASNRLSLVNHFLGISLGLGIYIPDVANAKLTNAESGAAGNLGDAAKACATAFGKQPNFLLVDFFDQGSAITTVDKINGITPVGRGDVKEVTDTPSSFTSGGSRSNGLFGRSVVSPMALLALAIACVQLVVSIF